MNKIKNTCINFIIYMILYHITVLFCMGIGSFVHWGSMFLFDFSEWEQSTRGMYALIFTAIIIRSIYDGYHDE